MATMETPFHDLFLDELRDLYHAEKQLTKALPKLAKNATSDELRTAIEDHLEETEAQVERLEQVFEMLDEKPRGKYCAGMAGIIEEGSDLLQNGADGAVLDAGIIAGAQRAEHYEIAAYGSVMAWAKVMGHDDVAQMLEETLNEEKAADEKLSALAEQAINAEAASSGKSNGSAGDEEMNGRAMAASGSAGRGQGAERRGRARK